MKSLYNYITEKILINKNSKSLPKWKLFFEEFPFSKTELTIIFDKIQEWVKTNNVNDEDIICVCSNKYEDKSFKFNEYIKNWEDIYKFNNKEHKNDFKLYKYTFIDFYINENVIWISPTYSIKDYIYVTTKNYINFCEWTLIKQQKNHYTNDSFFIAGDDGIEPP